MIYQTIKEGGSYLRTRWSWLFDGGVLALTTWWVMRQLWRPGVTSGVDMLMAVWRLFEFDRAWHVGILYPRLAPDFSYGYTLPLFQYYPPLQSLLAELPHLWGVPFIDSTKLTVGISLFLAGIGCYGLCRAIALERPGALGAAIAYLYAPYLLLNIYERGAVAELLALGIVPFLLWFTHIAFTRNRPDAYLGIGATSAALILAHNITALYFVPVFLVFILFHWRWLRTSGRQLIAGLGMYSLGLAIAAFYWMPAIMEAKYVDIEGMTEGILDPVHWLLPMHHLLQPYLVFNYLGATRFRMALTPVLLTTIALLLWRWYRAAERPLILFFATLFGIPLLLQLDFTAFFWQHASTLRFIQFPWRLLGFVYLGSAGLMGFLVNRLSRETALRLKNPYFMGTWLPFACLLAIIIPSSTLHLRLKDSKIWYSIGEEEITLNNLQEMSELGWGITQDYMPPWAAPAQDLFQPETTPQDDTLLAPPDDVVVRVKNLESYRASLDVESSRPFALALQRFFFPGWYAQVNGVKQSTRHRGALGLVAADIPAGQHNVSLYFGHTPLRRVAVWMTILAIGGWLGLALFKRQWAWVAIVGGVALLYALPAIPHLWLVDAPQPWQQADANLAHAVKLVGYRTDRAAYYPGDTVRLDIAWLGLKPIHESYKVFVHLVDQTKEKKWGQSDAVPNQFWTPTTRWQAGELVEDTHSFRIQPAAPPGTYTLLAGMYDPGTMHNLPITNQYSSLPGDRIILGTLEIR